ncbi:chromosome partitioning protein ParA [Vibrio ostreicida]|uniref:Chromosome partitioning protein ParA n=1 Tax=Vibrio ostreicida TaxID=526588 RepID=A0ABT8BWR1_9VIBR|nr:chromosome partitioning protein ParA [Vibrio ostreicida]MDN3610523.1 chromosome partitioning protein ParA [Vibrio ostreicida]NPD07476.1 chromosome partitioning protein ParA [Vibrio ostreicida]
MVSINGLPASVPGPNKANKASRKKESKKSSETSAIGQPSKVANAVAHSIRHVDESDIHKAQVQYDLPEGQGRQAMEAYLKVMNQAKRDELSQLLGVDIYI